MNALPVIESIAIQGRRPRQPAQMADLRETVDVTATVRDAETNPDELAYQWTASVGTFTGNGRAVTWTAPESDPGADSLLGAVVTITLRVTEMYGHPGEAKTFTHSTTSTQTLLLHDSGKEIGDMSRRFLELFSTTSIKDSNVVMQDFKRAVCPKPDEVDSEREQVEAHFTNFRMNEYTIGPAQVSINFGGSCAVPGEFLPGDACSAVRVRWDSTGPGGRAVTSGVDHLTAVYAPADSRWWLCSSRYERDSSFTGHAFYSR